MRAVIQRAARASVTIEGRVAGAIDRGLLVLVAVAEGDTPADGEWLAAKLAAATWTNRDSLSKRMTN
jgi:D-tyrosyl-tRNA(Tyr) deacylase